MLIANEKNIKKYARQLLGTLYFPWKEKELLEVCTKKTLDDYHDGRCHKSFAIHKWMLDIEKVMETFGVESVQDKKGNYAEYCNTGDSYALTILYYNGKLRIGCWADIAE